MVRASFYAHSPFELGDKVKVAEYNKNGILKVLGLPAAIEEKTITDIMTIYKLKSGKVEFRYELDNCGDYIELLTENEYYQKGAGNL